MTSQGQRFRRRALRRGYKVDEVDSFLDRVEATLAGEAGGSAVSAQEVHDVVFRVRFGGYDEWQVDLHLDRIERQLTELEERGPGRAADQRGPAPAERITAPVDRMPRPERVAQDPMGPPTVQVPPVPPMPPVPPKPTSRPGPVGQPPMGPAHPVPPVPVPQREPAYGRYDEPGFDTGYEPGRHGRADMTTEIRMPTDPTFGGQPGFAAPRYSPQPDFGVAPGAGYGGPAGVGAGPMSGGPGGGLAGDAARADQLRRTFQPRRFGSGYDRAQVDRLFDSVVAALAGRGPGAVSDADLDPSQFALVPGGYFEAEVNAALREVRELLARRR